MTPRYTTSTGLRIGAAWVPRPMPITSPDALLIQAALLEPRTQTEPGALRRIAAFFWRWL